MSLLSAHEYRFGFETNCSCDAPGIWSWSDYIEHIRQACTIRTVEELDALPDGSTVRDAGDLTWQRIDHFADDEHPDGWICVLDGDEPIELPALLIWHPSWERP